MILTEQQPQDNLALKYTTQTIKLENEKPVFMVDWEHSEAARLLKTRPDYQTISKTLQTLRTLKLYMAQPGGDAAHLQSTPNYFY